MITAEEFLKSQKIDLRQTSLNCVIDGYMRQPDLCWLMEAYFSAKMAEIRIKAENNELTDEDIAALEGRVVLPDNEKNIERPPDDVSFEPFTGHT